MVFFSLSALVFQQGSSAAAGTDGSTFLWIALIAGLLGLVFALFLARSVLAYDTGTPEMRLISNAIREGAEAFMSRQYTTIAALAVVLAIALFVGYKFSDFTSPLAVKVVISFLIGAACSAQPDYCKPIRRAVAAYRQRRRAERRAHALRSRDDRKTCAGSR